MSFRLPVGNGSFCAIFKTDARADCDIYGSLSRRACSLANLAGRPSILIQYADRYTCAVYVNAHSEFGERFWLCAEALAIPCNQIKTYNNIDVVLQHKSRASHTFTYIHGAHCITIVSVLQHKQTYVCVRRAMVSD